MIDAVPRNAIFNLFTHARRNSGTGHVKIMNWRERRCFVRQGLFGLAFVYAVGMVFYLLLSGQNLASFWLDAPQKDYLKRTREITRYPEPRFKTTIPTNTNEEHKEIRNETRKDIHDKPSVTLYFTVTQSEWWRAPLHIPHLIRNSMYNFAQVIVYVDSDVLPPPPQSDDNITLGDKQLLQLNPLPPDSKLTHELKRLQEEGWITEIRLVEMNQSRYEKILLNVFDADKKDRISPMLAYYKAGQRRGFLSYIQGMEECDTQYCAHFDVGMCVLKD